MYAITTQLRFFHNNSPGAERFLGTPRFWGIFKECLELICVDKKEESGSNLLLDFFQKQLYSINIITITVIERYERKMAMSTLKYSRQRESIKVCLQGRKDHPTADMLYTDVRKEFPNISLGTVYRNLSLLSELGEIKRLTTGDGPDRFDGDTSTHHHFVCRKCHCVTDLTMRDISEIKNVAAENFRGTIEDYSVNFYGICENCKNHPGNV